MRNKKEEWSIGLLEYFTTKSKHTGLTVEELLRGTSVDLDGHYYKRKRQGVKFIFNPKLKLADDTIYSDTGDFDIVDVSIAKTLIKETLWELDNKPLEELYE